MKREIDRERKVGGRNATYCMDEERKKGWE